MNTDRSRTLKPVEELKAHFGKPMSEAEVLFLRDIQGLIDYAVRNGLSFAMVLTALGHDIAHLRNYGNDLHLALQDAFTPMVQGYADATEESVGESVELDEDD